jgi:hypothetical protein
MTMRSLPVPLPASLRCALAAAALICGGVAHAEQGEATPAPASSPYALSADEMAGRRLIDVTVYGDDPCPATDDGTIIVCARKPEEERYRIPPNLRKEELAARAPTEQGWGSRAMGTEDASRVFIPNSCSPFGANGYTGCTQALLQQWYAERRAAGKLGVLGK